MKITQNNFLFSYFFHDDRRSTLFMGSIKFFRNLSSRVRWQGMEKYHVKRATKNKSHLKCLCFTALLIEQFAYMSNCVTPQTSINLSKTNAQTAAQSKAYWFWSRFEPVFFLFAAVDFPRYYSSWLHSPAKWPFKGRAIVSPFCVRADSECSRTIAVYV